MSRNIVLVDLDGTTFDNTKRAHLVPPVHLQSDPKNWTAFNRACVEFDVPVHPVIAVVNALYDSGREIIILTSRASDAWAETSIQVATAGLKHHGLIMRPMDNYLPPAALKEWTLSAIGADNVLLAIDDDDSVLELFQSKGIVTLKPSGLCASLRQ